MRIELMTSSLPRGMNTVRTQYNQGFSLLSVLVYRFEYQKCFYLSSFLKLLEKWITGSQISETLSRQRLEL